MIIDIAFILVIVTAIIKGFKRGLVIAVFSLLAIIIGLAAALKLSTVVAAYLERNLMTTTKWLPLISFCLVFLIVVILVGLAARVIKKTFHFAMLGWLDRLGGIFFYTILYTIILSIILFFAEKMLILTPEVISHSYTYKYISPLGPKVINGLGSIIPFFKDMFMQLQSFFESVAKKSG